MTFLRNRTEWRKWVKAETIESADVPKVFPCYGYEQVADWGMEWTRASYLYPDDLAEMVAKMMHEVGTAQKT